MTPKRVGIDLDGTVANYLHGAVPLLKEHYGLVPNLAKPSYTIEEVFGLTKETRPPGMRQLLYEELHLFRTLPKLEDDIEMLTVKLKQDGVKVYFVTARSGSHVIREDTWYWLEHNGFQFDDVFHTDRKADICKQARIRVMYEDEVGQLMDLQKARIDTVIRDQPWNTNLPRDPHYLERKKGRQAHVRNWREAYIAMKEYLE